MKSMMTPVCLLVCLFVLSPFPCPRERNTPPSTTTVATHSYFVIDVFIKQSTMQSIKQSTISIKFNHVNRINHTNQSILSMTSTMSINEPRQSLNLITHINHTNQSIASITSIASINQSINHAGVVSVAVFFSRPPLSTPWSRRQGRTGKRRQKKLWRRAIPLPIISRLRCSATRYF